MRSADKFAVRTVALICLFGVCTAHAQDKSTYGKVDTFEPGKKYSCLPTADRKGWDCTQNGKAVEPPPSPPPAPAPARATDRPAQSASTAVAEPAPSASEPAAPSAPAAVHSSELPGYLNARAGSGPAPQQPATPPPQPVQKEAISTSAPAVHDSSSSRAAATPPATAEPPPPDAAPVSAAPPAPASATPAPPSPAETSSSAAAPSTPQHAPTPAAKSSAEPAAPVAAREPQTASAAPPAHASSTGAAHSGEDFLALPADQYVIELAHAASAAELDALDVHPPRGEVYKLHLLQNGVDNWLLVWGSFDDVTGARAARAELAASASVTPGWPRRIAPLQAEVRRTRD
jgi:hypothetical protein